MCLASASDSTSPAPSRHRCCWRWSHCGSSRLQAWSSAERHFAGRARARIGRDYPFRFLADVCVTRVGRFRLISGCRTLCGLPIAKPFCARPVFSIHAHYLRRDIVSHTYSCFDRPHNARSKLVRHFRDGLACYGLGHHRSRVCGLVRVELGPTTRCYDQNSATAFPRSRSQRIYGMANPGRAYSVRADSWRSYCYWRPHPEPMG